VLLSPESIVVPNATGAAILALCDGQRTIAAVAAELRATYHGIVEDEIARYLERLALKRLVVLDGDASIGRDIS
jgi:pyrroloquinoline quinone biosynthesis protein D